MRFPASRRKTRVRRDAEHHTRDAYAPQTPQPANILSRFSSEALCFNGGAKVNNTEDSHRVSVAIHFLCLSRQFGTGVAL